MESKIVPFGKYKGQPMEVLVQDSNYYDWLKAQPWFRNKFPNFNTLIVNNMGEPAETPDHNRMQALFTDEYFCSEFIWYLKQFSTKSGFGEVFTGISDIDVAFEYKGVDVYMRYKNRFSSIGFHYTGLCRDEDPKNTPFYSYGSYAIEIKPVLADDYPAVLRQMQKNKSSVLFIGSYTGDGASFEQVAKIFKSTNRHIVTLQDINDFTL